MPNETSNESTSIFIDAETNANPNILFNADGKKVVNLRYDDAATKNFQIQINSNLESAMDFTMDGKIGIGTNNPSRKLDVRGSVNISKELDVNQRAFKNGSIYTNSKLIGESFTIELMVKILIYQNELHLNRSEVDLL